MEDKYKYIFAGSEDYEIQDSIIEGAYNEQDEYGRYLPSGALSSSEIEVLDLISEGPIEGLVSGEYKYSGIAGEVGYRTATFTPYTDAPNLPSVKFLRSVYWNEVPVINSANKYNFQRVDVSYTKGLPNGSYVNQANPELTVSRTISERLYGTELNSSGEASNNSTDYIKYYRILNRDCKGAILNIKVSRLAMTDKTTGELYKSIVEYRIYYKPIFTYNTQFNTSYILGKTDKIEGKINYGFVKSSRVDFFVPNDMPHDFIGWEIKVVRTTPDSLSTLLVNQTYIDSITEIYSDKFLYPNSAIVRSRFDAQYFAQVPARAFDAKLLKVAIPSNYEPITKTYIEGAEGWDGTFASEKQWTDNPAWCYYDLIANPRYGLSKFIPNLTVDKWSLYEIAKYCDTLVYDGYGGVEPRFSCNLVINTRDDAYKVLNDMASIFRGITYYSQGSVFAVQDTEKEPIVLFNNSNVENGDFHYSSSAKRARHTVAVVRYNDKTNFFKPAIEYVEDLDGIRRYGIKELDVTAFGCTSKGQAIRLGRWILLTETLETETISFIAGLESHYLRPGDVFKVFDSNRKNTRYAGRLYYSDLIGNSGSATGSFVLDCQLGSIDANRVYKMEVMAPSFNYNPLDTQGLTSVDSSGIRNSFVQTIYFTGFSTGVHAATNNTIVYLSNPVDVGNFDFSQNDSVIWSVSPSGDLTNDDSSRYSSNDYDLYRCINIKENDINKYEITALQYSPQKYIEIESGLNFERNVATYRAQPVAPQDLILFQQNGTENKPIIEYSFTMSDYAGVNSFKVFAKKDDWTSSAVPNDDYLITTLPYSQTNDTFIPAESGSYYFRVYASNDEASILSNSAATGLIHITKQFPVKDIVINSLRLEADTALNPQGVRLTGEYFTQSPTFQWQAGTLNDNSLPSQFKYRVSIRHPSNSNIPSSTILFSKNNVKPDSSLLKYTFDFDDNKNTVGGPYREYDVVVEAIDSNGLTSAGNTVNLTTNTATEVWNSSQLNANGYDILSILNNKPSGFYLSTGNNVVYSNYSSRQWVDANGTIFGVFTSGTIPSDIVGGFAYYSTGLISGLEGVTGSPFNYKIFTGEFSYDLYSQAFYIPPNKNVDAENALQLAKTGYLQVSLYDSFDDEVIDAYLATQTGTLYFLSGLYRTNPGRFNSNGYVNTISAGTALTVHNEGNRAESSSLKVANDGTNWILKSVDQNGNEIIIATKS